MYSFKPLLFIIQCFEQKLVLGLLSIQTNNLKQVFTCNNASDANRPIAEGPQDTSSHEREVPVLL